jgi:uncharacterized membrane protein
MIKSVIGMLREFLVKLARARTFLFIVIPALVCAVASMCFVEVAGLQFLFAEAAQPLRFSLVFVSALVLLLILNFALSLLCLYLTEAAQAAGVAETAVLILFAIAYASVARQSMLQPLLYLICGKIMVTVLFARFWHAKFREYRMRYRDKPSARFFLERRRRFLSCSWVVMGSWFITALALTLALVESQNLLQLEGWEGLLLLATFFSLFWIFVRNPNSHPDSFEEA